MRDLIVCAIVLAASIIIICLMFAMTGCASTGFYNMSDDWCAQHSNASQARCPGNGR